MTKMILAFALMMSAQAMAQVSSAETTAGLGVSTLAPSVTTICTTTECAAYNGADAKIIAAAKDDAAAYVASNGQLQSAALERAFQLVRSTNTNLQISDMDLAQVILTQH
jgi:uncharacterized protein (TIGR02448 family)